LLVGYEFLAKKRFVSRQNMVNVRYDLRLRKELIIGNIKDGGS